MPKIIRILIMQVFDHGQTHKGHSFLRMTLISELYFNFFFFMVKYICHENNIHESIFIGYIYLFWLGLMLLTLPARTNVWEMYSCIHVWSPLMSINIICSSNQITPIPSFLLSLCFVLRVSLSTKTCICINAELKRIVNDGDVRRDIELRESVQVRPRPTALIIIHSFLNS